MSKFWFKGQKLMNGWIANRMYTTVTGRSRSSSTTRTSFTFPSIATTMDTSFLEQEILWRYFTLITARYLLIINSIFLFLLFFFAVWHRRWSRFQREYRMVRRFESANGRRRIFGRLPHFSYAHS